MADRLAPLVHVNCTAGQWLAVGVPGSGTTAVLLAVLLSLNVMPGPLLFTINPDIACGLIAALFIANVMPLSIGLWLFAVFGFVLLILVGRRIKS